MHRLTFSIFFISTFTHVGLLARPALGGMPKLFCEATFWPGRTWDFAADFTRKTCVNDPVANQCGSSRHA